MDLGAPASYLTLREGTDVYSADGRRIGTVAHVLAAEDEDIFDGIVVEGSLGAGGHRFADAPQVEEIYERGVVLTLDAAACDSLPEPSESPAALEAGPEATEPDDLGDKLRRAWQRISGDY